MQALYWNLSAAERDRLNSFDIVIVEDAETPIKSSPRDVTIRADAFVSLLNIRRSSDNRIWYPAFSFIMAHEMAHWVLPEASAGQPLALKEIRADRFAIQLSRSAGERVDSSWLNDEGAIRLKRAAAALDKLDAQIDALPRVFNPADPKGHYVREFDAQALRSRNRDMISSAAGDCLLGSELLLRGSSIAVQDRLSEQSDTTTAGFKQLQVEVLRIDRASMENAIKELDRCVRMLDQLPPRRYRPPRGAVVSEHRHALRRMGALERALELRQEMNDRLADSEWVTDSDWSTMMHPRLLSRDEVWRERASMRASASIGPAMTAFFSQDQKTYWSTVGGLFTARLTWHGDGILNGMGAALTLGGYAASVSSDVGSENANGARTPADIQSLRLGLSYVRGRPLTGPLMFVYALEFGYFRESYNLRELMGTVVVSGFACSAQGELALRIASGLHAGLGVRIVPLFFPGNRVDITVPLTLAGYF